MRGEARHGIGASWLHAAILLSLAGVPATQGMGGEMNHEPVPWTAGPTARSLEGAPIANDLRHTLERSDPDQELKLIIQTFAPAGTVRSELEQAYPLRVKRVLEGIGTIAARLPAGLVPDLAADPREVDLTGPHRAGGQLRSGHEEHDHGGAERPQPSGDHHRGQPGDRVGGEPIRNQWRRNRGRHPGLGHLPDKLRISKAHCAHRVSSRLLGGLHR